ncbi:MAG TPA: DUF4912 domain-containing protein [Planctomycetota bacterium]|jgi:hypothetical protein
MNTKPKPRAPRSAPVIAPANPSGKPTHGGDSAPASEPIAKRKALRRETVHTLQERQKQLSELASLKQSGTPAVLPPAPAVEASSKAPPPPAEPIAAAESVDRGAPIPDHYGMDRLVAMPRDAEWVYVYWELKGGSLDRLRFNCSAEVIDNARWILRVQSLSARGEATQRLVDVDLRASNWYLKAAPGWRLKIELGFVNAHGEFVLVLTANEIGMPTPSVSEVVDERWLIQRQELEKLLAAAEVDGVGGSSSGAPRFTRVEQPRAMGVIPPPL